MKIVTIVGARPQFIKMAAISRAIRQHNLSGAAEVLEVIIHTGQHYDADMSEVFFRELEIDPPKYNLEVGSGGHGEQTGEILKRIEPVLKDERPDAVVVYGDTNSTLAGALAAAKLDQPVAHVEAGLRSWNRRMPEEINRVVVDHLSTLLFCPTETAVNNLKREGITRGVHLAGDVMQDVLFSNLTIAEKSSDVLTRLKIRPGNYLLATIHRAENTDDPTKLGGIIETLARIAASGATVVFPIHPRTRKALEEGIGTRDAMKSIRWIDPVGHRDMVWLEHNARMVLTDSGGVQKEAYWLNVPCAVLREETEWIETVSDATNQLVGSDPDRIWRAYQEMESSPRKDLPKLKRPTQSASSRHLKILLSSGGIS